MEDNWILITAFPLKILPHSMWVGLYEAITQILYRFTAGKWRRKPDPVFLPGKPHGQRSPRATVHGAAKSCASLSTCAQ